jgi:hypothetical protein
MTTDYRAMCAELVDSVELLLEMRAVDALWPSLKIAVAVSEDLPEPGEWVWHCYAGVRLWQHGRYNGRQFFIDDGPESQPATHWLPANALPTPEA